MKSFLRCPAVHVLLLSLALVERSVTAVTLSDEEVDRFNVRVGTQTFGPLYHFTTNTTLVETAEAIRDMGSDVIKFYLCSGSGGQYGVTLPPSVTNLASLAKNEPSCRRVLDMPFRHFVVWAYCFAATSDAWWQDGFSATEKIKEYNEIYAFACYLLTNYNNAGKSFYLGHWEGDWYLLPNYNTSTNPTPTAIQGMRDWLNTRQQAVDDAMRNTPHTNVSVFLYTEANRVRDAMQNPTNTNQRVINEVVPYVTNLDFVSWSSYDGMNLGAADLSATLDYMASLLPTNKAAALPGRRVFIGKYGWGGSYSSAAQEPLTRGYIQKLVQWGTPFILFWEMYNNETNRAYWLIDNTGAKTPCWYLHQRYGNTARLAVARFKESNGRLPTDTEFAALVTPSLDQPLPTPVNLAVANFGTSSVTTNSAVVTGTLTQGVYGDEAATVWVFWGTQDDGTARGGWTHQTLVGTNTHFNSASFAATLAGLTPRTDYFFRFYATNASGEAWAPLAGRLTTDLVNPFAFTDTMKITFSGYTRGETLLNFPALVLLHTNLAGFSYARFASPTGGDLRFTDASGTRQLNHEIDEWNTNGVSSVWVQVPALAGTNDFIRAYWGNPLGTNAPASLPNGSVWSQNYELVWHLKETNLPYADSALLHPALAGSAPVATNAGVVGRAESFNGTANYLDAGTVSLGDACTLSAWVRLDTNASSIQTIWANKSGGWNSDGVGLYVNSYLTSDQKLLLETGNGTNGVTAATPTNLLTAGAWHHVAAVVDRAAGQSKLFVDGTERTQYSGIRDDFANQRSVNLGRFADGGYKFKGLMDEARIATTAQSSSWIWATWLNVASNTAFASYASVEHSNRFGMAVVLVPSGTVWKYSDTGTNLGTAWRSNSFSDSAWLSGPAELGYGDTSDGRPEKTVIGYGTNVNSKYITTYFRRAFTVANPAALTNLIVGLMRDDGGVVYLNGVEIYRNNMPAGTVSYTTLALTNVNAGADEFTFYQTNVSPALLRSGTNLLAVEMHQNAGTSSDLSFDLFLVGQCATQSFSGMTLYVASNGNDDWVGSSPQLGGTDGPFATLERARDLLRVYTVNGWLPPGGAVVEVAGGVYPLSRSLDFTAADSGTALAPIVWRAKAGEEVRLTGGRYLSGFRLTTNETVLAKLDLLARGRIWETDLRALGLTNFPAPQAGSGWAQSEPGLEFFFADKPMTLARYPNESYMNIVKALGPTTNNVRGTIGTVEGIFSYSGDRPLRWVGEPDVMVQGFWFWDWADQRQKVASIDTVSNIITVAAPWHTYGYRDDQWFYAYNLLPELDEPGEWYLDRTNGVLYFWPPSPISNSLAMVSLATNLVTISNASFFTLQGFIFEGCQKDAISITGGATNCVQACTLRNLGKNAIRITDSPGSGVSGCEIYFTGEGGINLSGGTRSTLTPAGIYAEHNHLHHYSRWNPVYHAGISISGVGQRVTHNLIHDAPHEGIAFGGNDHLIEYNEFHNVVSESNDAGVIYGGRDWTMRGHVIRYNYFHHIYGFERKGCNCVYLDDQFSSALVYGNLFYDVPTAVLIGGGRENTVENNIFVKCQRAVSLDARGLGWAADGFAGLSNKVVALPYQTPPWSTRYPELTNIFNEDPMAPRGNLIDHNISWNGGWVSIETAALPGVLVTNNLVNIDPHFVDTNHLDFRLLPDSPAFGVGFAAFPLDLFGPDTNTTHAPWIPTVTITQPAADAVFLRPASIAWEVVLSDPGHTATGAQLFADYAPLALTTNFPFLFQWTNAAAGAHFLSALPASAAGFGPLRPLTIHVDDSLVSTGAVWKFLDNGSNQGTAWRSNNFNDVTWAFGPAQLGYGDGDEATVVSYGTNVNAKYITTYFRRAFTVADPAAYTNIVLGLLRDDGAVVYLNGVEVFRSNMTNAPITYTTLALTSMSGSGETTFYTTNVDLTLLRAGTNLLAVEVHQNAGTSSDVSFDLYLIGVRAGELALNLAPVITAHPQSRTNLAGTEAVFSVVANGSSAMQYQWFLDSNALPAATSRCPTHSPPTPASTESW